MTGPHGNPIFNFLKNRQAVFHSKPRCVFWAGASYFLVELAMSIIYLFNSLTSTHRFFAEGFCTSS